MQRNIYILLTVILFGMSCSKPRENLVPAEKQREYANALFNRELYSQSVQEYQKYLDNYDVEPNIRASINYEIGNIYFERINDYENAISRANCTSKCNTKSGIQNAPGNLHCGECFTSHY